VAVDGMGWGWRKLPRYPQSPQGCADEILSVTVNLSRDRIRPRTLRYLSLNVLQPRLVPAFGFAAFGSLRFRVAAFANRRGVATGQRSRLDRPGRRQRGAGRATTALSGGNARPSHQSALRDSFTRSLVVDSRSPSPAYIADHFFTRHPLPTYLSSSALEICTGPSLPGRISMKATEVLHGSDAAFVDLADSATYFS